MGGALLVGGIEVGGPLGAIMPTEASDGGKGLFEANAAIVFRCV